MKLCAFGQVYRLQRSSDWTLWRLPSVRLVFGCLFGLAVIGSPLVVNAEEPIKTVKVVELFTSQGCSSCPPADALLESYVNKPDVVALSYSVDYWDYLGWRDTFGSAANSERQRAYARQRGDRAVYTPQAVVNGLAHVNGALKRAINQKISETQKELAAKPLALTAEQVADKVVVKANSSIEQWPEAPVLWLVRVKDVGRVKVQRGENHGKILEYHNIVLGVEKVATMQGASLEVSVAKQKVYPAKGEHGVFLLQLGSSGAILAAAEMR